LLGRSSASPLALRALSSSNSNGGEAEPGEVGKSKSWAPADTTQLHKMARQSMLHELAVKQQSTLEGVVDWFLTNMPATYFRQTSEEARLEHLLAITSMMEPNFFDSFRFQERWVDSRREITFIQPGSKRSPGSLLSLMESLPPADGTLSRVKVFVSLDGNLAINVFSYAPKSQVKEPPTDADKANLLQYAALVQAREDTGPGGATALEPSPLFEPEALESYLAWCEGEYVRRSHPRRFLTQRLLYEKVKGSEGVAVHIESYDGSEQGTLAVDEAMGQGVRPHWVTLALANVMPKIALTQVLRLFLPHELKVLRVHMDLVNDPRNGGSVTMLRALVMPPIGDVQKDGGVSSWASPDAWEPLKAALPRLKWLDETVFRLGLESEIKMGLRHAEVTNALVSMVYGILHKVNPWAFTRTHMSQWLETPRYGRHAMAIAQLFIDRFNPDAPLSNEEFTKRADSLCEKFRRDVELTELQVLLCKMVDAVRSTLRTNLYVPKRYALSMRLSPELLMTAEEQAAKEIPYGVFFVHGRRFNAFHVRFRDIARGGMRIVTPLTAEQVAFEGTRQFDEAYGLAFAQQLKNKVRAFREALLPSPPPPV
jgi:glutamate dehydrogenase